MLVSPLQSVLEGVRSLQSTKSTVREGKAT